MNTIEPSESYITGITGMSDHSNEETDNDISTEEIEEIKELEYVKHSSTDTVWLQKKWTFILIVLFSNLGLIALVMFTDASAYIMIPFITLSHIRDVIYVVVAIVAKTARLEKKRWGKKVDIKIGTAVRMASIVTCYTEKYETVLETCLSLYRSAKSSKQKVGVSAQNTVICICDGQLTGAENDKPLSDLFKNEMTDYKRPFVRRYKTWRNETATAIVHVGYLHEKDNIFILVRKLKNHGKKDGLILAKKIISDINARRYKYAIFPPNKDDSEIIKYTFSTDADTAIDVNCIPKCVKNMENYPELDAAVCLLRVLFHKRSLFWDHMQHFQYFSSQFVRRGTESFLAKVSCLSGAGNICRVSSKAYSYANYHYEKYPKTTSLLDVVPKMNGTDRRYTTLMLKADKNTKIAMLPKSFVYTETPQDFLTYISQRKRWGSNSFSNSLVNFTSRNFPWYLKISSLIDVFRILSSYFRIMSYVWFWVYITEVEMAVIIFVAATIGLVYSYTFLIVIMYGDKRLSLLYGFICNKLTSPIFSALIFSEILFRFDDFKWGMTQKVKDDGLDLAAELLGETAKGLGKKENEFCENLEIVIDGMYNETGNEVGKEKKLKQIGKKQKFKKRRVKKKKHDKYIADKLKEIGTGKTNLFDMFGKLSNEEQIKSLTRLPIRTTNIASPSVIGGKKRRTNGSNINDSSDDSNDTSDTTDTTVVNEVILAGNIPAPPPPPPPTLRNVDPNRPRTKTIHWKTILKNKGKDTFWERNRFIQLSLNEEEIMKLFEDSINQMKSEKKADLQNLVDFKKLHFTGMIFQKFGWKVDNIVRDIETCSLDEDKLTALMPLFPLTDTEIHNLQEFIKHPPETAVSIPQQFFLSVFHIPNIHERLECCIFKDSCSELLFDLRGYSTTLEKACSSLKNSKKFANVLRLIFKVGSFLNKDTYLDKQNVVGFRLDILPKLKHTKTVEKSKTLMHYLVETIVTKAPHLRYFYKDLTNVSAASKLNISSITQLWKFIENNQTTLKTQLKLHNKAQGAQGNQAGNVEDYDIGFTNVFEPFYEQTKENIELGKQYMTNSIALFKEIVTFYGEDPQTIGIEEFFGYITEFVEDYKKIFKQYADQSSIRNGSIRSIRNGSIQSTLNGSIRNGSIITKIPNTPNMQTPNKTVVI